MSLNSFVQAVQPYLTIEHARAWQAETDKYLWIESNILDAIEFRANDARVEYIEEIFASMLAD